MLLRSLAPAALAAGVVLCAAAGSASGATILPGLYRLHNHPDGNERPPLYGARFDELFDVTTGHDVFTMDFDNIQSAVYMTINPALNQIHIFGQSYGGRDTGSALANDSHRGLYQIDFTYNLGVGPAMGDDDLVVVTPDHRNFGTLTTPGGTVVSLTDQGMDGKTFRFGDEDNDLGHRGFNGLSGWGWMSYVSPTAIRHVDSTDWLFTATYEIPAPGAAALAGIGGLLMARRRRA